MRKILTLLTSVERRRTVVLLDPESIGSVLKTVGIGLAISEFALLILTRLGEQTNRRFNQLSSYEALPISRPPSTAFPNNKMSVQNLE